MPSMPWPVATITRSSAGVRPTIGMPSEDIGRRPRQTCETRAPATPSMWRTPASDHRVDAPPAERVGVGAELERAREAQAAGERRHDDARLVQVDGLSAPRPRGPRTRRGSPSHPASGSVTSRSCASRARPDARRRARAVWPRSRRSWSSMRSSAAVRSTASTSTPSSTRAPRRVARLGDAAACTASESTCASSGIERGALRAEDRRLPLAQRRRHRAARPRMPGVAVLGDRAVAPGEPGLAEVDVQRPGLRRDRCRARAAHARWQLDALDREPAQERGAGMGVAGQRRRREAREPRQRGAVAVAARTARRDRAGSGCPRAAWPREAMRSAWLAVTMQAVPAEAPMPTAPRSSTHDLVPVARERVGGGGSDGAGADHHDLRRRREGRHRRTMLSARRHLRCRADRSRHGGPRNAARGRVHAGRDPVRRRRARSTSTR